MNKFIFLFLVSMPFLSTVSFGSDIPAIRNLDCTSEGEREIEDVQERIRDGFSEREELKDQYEFLNDIKRNLNEQCSREHLSKSDYHWCRMKKAEVEEAKEALKDEFETVTMGITKAVNTRKQLINLHCQ